MAGYYTSGGPQGSLPTDLPADILHPQADGDHRAVGGGGLRVAQPGVQMVSRIYTL